MVRLLLVLLAAPGFAHADTPTEAKALMRDYLDGEKAGGYVLVGLGAAGVTAGSFLLRSDCDTQVGIAYPLLTAGALQLAAGVYIGMQSDRRIDAFNTEIDRDGQAWVVRERERMDGVKTQFTVLKIVEIGLIAGGATLAYVGWKRRRFTMHGVGVGIAIEAAVTLGFDIWAASRANAYSDDLGALDLTTPRISHTFTF